MSFLTAESVNLFRLSRCGVEKFCIFLYVFFCHDIRKDTLQCCSGLFIR